MYTIWIWFIHTISNTKLFAAIVTPAIGLTIDHESYWRCLTARWNIDRHVTDGCYDLYQWRLIERRSWMQILNADPDYSCSDARHNSHHLMWGHRVLAITCNCKKFILVKCGHKTRCEPRIRASIAKLAIPIMTATVHLSSSSSNKYIRSTRKRNINHPFMAHNLYRSWLETDMLGNCYSLNRTHNHYHYRWPRLPHRLNFQTSRFSWQSAASLCCVQHLEDGP